MTETFVLVPGKLEEEGFWPTDQINWHISVHPSEIRYEQQVSVSIHDREIAIDLAFQILKQVHEGRDIVELILHAKNRHVMVAADDTWCEEASEPEAARAKALIDARVDP